MILKRILFPAAVLILTIILAGCTGNKDSEAPKETPDQYVFPGIISEFTFDNITAVLEYSEDNKTVAINTQGNKSYILTLNDDGVIIAVKTSMLGVLLTNFEEKSPEFPKVSKNADGHITEIEYSKFIASLKRHDSGELFEISYEWKDDNTKNRIFDKNDYARVQNIKHIPSTSKANELFGTVIYFMSLIDMLNSAN